MFAVQNHLLHQIKIFFGHKKGRKEKRKKKKEKEKEKKEKNTPKGGLLACVGVAPQHW